MKGHLGIAVLKESRAVATELYARARFPAHGLRRYAERAEECATHAFTVSKTRFSRYLVNGVPPFLHHEPGSLQSQLFNGFCRGLTGFRQESATELTRAEACDGCEFVNRKRVAQI